MASQMEKTFATLTSSAQAPLSSTLSVQDDTGALSRKERIVIILMVLMIFLLICVAGFAKRGIRKRSFQHAGDAAAQNRMVIDQ